MSVEGLRALFLSIIVSSVLWYIIFKVYGIIE